MLSLRKNSDILKHSADTLEVVRKAYNLHQPGRVEESVDRLLEWIQAQPHFHKKDFSRDYLETYLTNNKGSVEKAKKNLDKLCAVKTFGTKLFITSKKPIDMEGFEDLPIAPLPSLTSDHCRIFMFRNSIRKYDPNVVYNFCIYGAFLLEGMLKYNYSMGLVVVIDYREAELQKLITQVAENRHNFMLLLNGYQMRIQSLHIISTSKLVETLLSIVKSVVNPKVLGRIVMHKNLESLYKHVDKSLLPSDYGGKERPLKELSDEWMKFASADKYIAYADEMFKATIDTSKKPKDEFNELYLGMPGTFRTLQID